MDPLQEMAEKLNKMAEELPLGEDSRQSLVRAALYALSASMDLGEAVTLSATLYMLDTGTNVLRNQASMN